MKIKSDQKVIYINLKLTDDMPSTLQQYTKKELRKEIKNALESLYLTTHVIDVSIEKEP